MIAVTLTNPKLLKLANATQADFIEIRTDLYPKANFTNLLNRCEKPVIFTIKSAQTVLLDHIDSPKVKYVDIDYRLHRLIRDFRTLRPKRTKLIVSYHDYKETRSWKELSERVTKLRTLKPDVIKIATMIEEFDDLHITMRLQKKLKNKGIVIGMGDLGIMSRIYNKSLLTYARLNVKTTAAPGQLTVDELKSMQLYGLAGHRIQESLSPVMHNAAFEHFKIPHLYQLWDTTDAKKFMEVFNFFELPGASVTMPFKHDVMPYLDKIDVHAKKIGAVNTLVRKGNKIIGYNTDWLGVRTALKGKLKNKKVLILGSGGAAAAVYYAAKKNHATSVNMLTRHEMPTEEDDYDVLVNATPVYDMVLVPEDSLYSKVVMDCNYGKPTVLLRQATQKSHKVINGLPMLLHQGVEQFTLWTGKKMPVRKIEQLLKISQ